MPLYLAEPLTAEFSPRFKGVVEGGIRFIGSKQRLLPFITDRMQSVLTGHEKRFGDLFTGTAAVARAFKQLGKDVTANDNLRCCYVFARAVLSLSHDPDFNGLAKTGEISAQLSGSVYDAVLARLNSLSGEEGLFFREYSAGPENEFGRPYFSSLNARKIDAIRKKIFAWLRTGVISEAEWALLISDLMRAANRVANTSGTYGCFNKQWDKRASKPLELQRSGIVRGDGKHNVWCTDAKEVARQQSFDVVYLDPPYTWRHYGAYYHILETIAAGDEPTVSGKTGLRPWGMSKSRFADRSQAPAALKELIDHLDTRHIFLSYSSEGLIDHDVIMEILRARGPVHWWEITHRRFKSNNSGSNEKTVIERLYHAKTNEAS